MNRKRSQRLKPLQKLAGHGESSAARALGESQHALAEQETRLEQLRSYRSEYREMLEARDRSVDPRTLRDVRAFLERLDEVIRQQEQVVEQKTQNYDNKRAVWVQAHSRTSALERAGDRSRAAEEREHERGEQHEQDDLAGQRNGR